MTKRITELTEHVRRLEHSEAKARTEAAVLQTRVVDLETDLAVARTSLRKMIRQASSDDGP